MSLTKINALTRCPSKWQSAGAKRVSGTLTQLAALRQFLDLIGTQPNGAISKVFRLPPRGYNLVQSRRRETPKSRGATRAAFVPSAGNIPQISIVGSVSDWGVGRDRPSPAVGLSSVCSYLILLWKP